MAWGQAQDQIPFLGAPMSVSTPPWAATLYPSSPAHMVSICSIHGTVDSRSWWSWAPSATGTPECVKMVPESQLSGLFPRTSSQRWTPLRK